MSPTLSPSHSALANDRLHTEGESPPQISILKIEHQIKCIAKFCILNLHSVIATSSTQQRGVCGGLPHKSVSLNTK
jgi:hypothetical protein